MEPLRGHGLVVVESKLVFSLVDTFFGGSGESKVEIAGRDFSAIETRMTKSVVVQALSDLELAWKPVHSVNITYVRSEVNPQFAAIVPPTDIVLVILFEVDMEGFSGTITFCIPYSTLEPIMPLLKQQFQSEQIEVDQGWLRRLRDELLQAEMELVVELGKVTVMARDMLSLKVGDTLSLGNDVSDPLIVTAEGVSKFKGYPGVSRGNKAVQITKILHRED
tara:strand:- start:187 stop:849 length:663 start_codon:yes stop_codon:yes gene_type:complete